MIGIIYRQATAKDISTMAALRLTSRWSGGAGVETMCRYLAGEHHPQQAKAPRTAFVAEAEEALVGFIAGHLTGALGAMASCSGCWWHPRGGVPLSRAGCSRNWRN